MSVTADGALGFVGVSTPWLEGTDSSCRCLSAFKRNFTDVPLYVNFSKHQSEIRLICPLHSVFITSNKVMIQFCYTHYVNCPTLNGSWVKWKRGVFFWAGGGRGCFVSLHSTSPQQYIFALRYFSLWQFSDILLYVAIESLWTKEIKTCRNKKKKSLPIDLESPIVNQFGCCSLKSLCYESRPISNTTTSWGSVALTHRAPCPSLETPKQHLVL